MRYLSRKKAQNGPRIKFFKFYRKSVHQIYLTSLHEVTVPEKLKIEIDLNDFVEEEGVAGGEGNFCLWAQNEFFQFL